MKKHLLCIVALAISAIGFTACSSDNDDNGGTKLPDTSTLAGATSLELSIPIDGGIHLSSFKATPKTATEGTAVLTFKRTDMMPKYYLPTETYLVKEYTYKDGTYNIPTFGSISVSKSGSTISVTVAPEDGETKTYTAKEVSAFATDDLSKSICRTWTIVRTQFRYVEYKEDRTQKPAIGTQFTGSNLKEMAAWLYADPRNIDIRQELGEKESIESVTFDPYGTFIIKFKNQDYVGTWRWDKPAGTFTYEWNDEILMNNTVFENGTATITVDKGTGISVLSLTGNIEQNSSGTLYEVSLKLTMQPK